MLNLNVYDQLHFVDFTDLKNPKEVARYELPFQTVWIENDVVYAGMYNGGLNSDY